MSRLARSLALAVLAASAASAVPGGPRIATARADGDAAAPPAAAPAALFEQTDRKKLMSMKLPKWWKSFTGDEADPKALATFKGSYGAETSGRGGLIAFYVEGSFSRAGLARAVLLPRIGEVQAQSARQGPGWAEGCAIDASKQAQWRRFVEKSGRVYMFAAVAQSMFYDTIRTDVEELLDTAAVPGEYAAPPLGDAWTPRKGGEFDVLSDAEPDRDGAVKKACTVLGEARGVLVKMLPGKPFDTGKPVAWVFQNGGKFEDRGKAVIGKKPEHALFNPGDRCAMVSILGDNTVGHDDAVFQAGAEQYVSQYFGGEAPLWVSVGLAKCGQLVALGGGKAKVPADAVTKVKTAVVAGKRRLDEWFDVTGENQVTDMDQARYELFAWHWYLRVGKGAKKFKKQYDACIQTLRDTGDPAAARKAFDGVNFADMLADFRSWAAEWKQ